MEKLMVHVYNARYATRFKLEDIEGYVTKAYYSPTSNSCCVLFRDAASAESAIATLSQYRYVTYAHFHKIPKGLKEEYRKRKKREWHPPQLNANQEAPERDPKRQRTHTTGHTHDSGKDQPHNPRMITLTPNKHLVEKRVDKTPAPMPTRRRTTVRKSRWDREPQREDGNSLGGQSTAVPVVVAPTSNPIPAPTSNLVPVVVAPASNPVPVRVVPTSNLVPVMVVPVLNPVKVQPVLPVSVARRAPSAEIEAVTKLEEDMNLMTSLTLTRLVDGTSVPELVLDQMELDVVESVESPYEVKLKILDRSTATRDQGGPYVEELTDAQRLFQRELSFAFNPQLLPHLIAAAALGEHNQPGQQTLRFGQRTEPEVAQTSFESVLQQLSTPSSLRATLVASTTATAPSSTSTTSAISTPTSATIATTTATMSSNTLSEISKSTTAPRSATSTPTTSTRSTPTTTISATAHKPHPSGLGSEVSLSDSRITSGRIIGSGEEGDIARQLDLLMELPDLRSSSSSEISIEESRRGFVLQEKASTSVLSAEKGIIGLQLWGKEGQVTSLPGLAASVDYDVLVDTRETTHIPAKEVAVESVGVATQGTEVLAYFVEDPSGELKEGTSYRLHRGLEVDGAEQEVEADRAHFNYLSGGLAEGTAHKPIRGLEVEVETGANRAYFDYSSGGLAEDTAGVDSALGEKGFAKLMVSTYGEICCVTGSRLSLQAAHLTPYSVTKKHNPSNGLIFASNWHGLYDKFYWTLDEHSDTRSYVIHLGPDMLRDKAYASYDGKALGEFDPDLKEKIGNTLDPKKLCYQRERFYARHLQQLL